MSTTAEGVPAVAGCSRTSPVPDKEKGDELPPSRSPSPDLVKCAICLEELVNKSYSNSCCHQFCFACLLEWSKVKPECPLCKSPFRSIIHNIRSIADYDEYVVPANIPHLSIRLTTSDRYSPDIMLIDRQRRLDAIHDAVHARSHQLDRYARAFSDHPDPRNRIIRYLEVSERGNNFSLTSFWERESNPFRNTSEPDYFHPSIDLTSGSDSYSGNGQSIPGYQSRRRIYDRNQYVLPFHSNLQPGTVFFPSVEYFRTHPAAMARVTPWLHRELLVLLGLTCSQQQLADIYELIINLLQNYDIRSREFRSMSRIYFGSKIKHFQHEFYHFLLSGMRMTDYDNAATYSLSPSGNANSGTTEAPPVVTLDSDNENEPTINLDFDDDEVVVLSPNGGMAAPPAPDPMSRRPLPASSESRRFSDAYGSITPVTPIPVSSSSSLSSSFRPMDSLTSSSSTTGVEDRRAEPGVSGASGEWMPWTPHLSRIASHRHSHANVLPDYSLNPCSFLSDPWASLDSDLSRIPGRDVTVTPISSLSPNVTQWETNSNSSTRAFPSTRRRTRERSEKRRHFRGGGGGGDRETAAETRHSKRLKTSANQGQDKDRSSSYRIRLRSSGRNAAQGESSTSASRCMESSSTFPVGCSVTELAAGENYTYNSRPLSGSGIGVSIRIIGRNNNGNNVEGSSQSEEDSNVPTESTSSNSKNNSGSGLFSWSRKMENQYQSQSTKQEEVQIGGESEDEDCVMLGVHPVVKKPPLAVITISSDDEEEETRKRMKAEQKDRTTTEPSEQDSFLAMLNSVDHSFDESILDYSLATFEPLETPGVHEIGLSGDKRNADQIGDQLSTVSQKFFDSLASSHFFAPSASTSTSSASRQKTGSGGGGSSQSNSHSYFLGNPRMSSVIANPTAVQPYSQNYSPSSPIYIATSPYTPVSPPAPLYPVSNYSESELLQNSTKRDLGLADAKMKQKFYSGMKKSSYYARSLSSDEPSTSASSSRKRRTRSSFKSAKIKDDITKDKDSKSKSSSHKKKGKHKKSKKSLSHKKKSKKAKRHSSFSLTSSSSSSSSEEDSFICDEDSSEVAWLDDEDSDFKYATKKKSTKPQKLIKKTRASKKLKEKETKNPCTREKDKKHEVKRKGGKKLRPYDSDSSSEDNCPLMERLKEKGSKTIRRPRIIANSDSSSESEKAGSSRKDGSKGDTNKNKFPVSSVSSNNSDVDVSRPGPSNFGVDLRAPTLFDLTMESSNSHTHTPRGSNNYTVKTHKGHRWESDGNEEDTDKEDPFILTPSTLGMHHVGSSSNSNIECRIISDSSENSRDEIQTRVDLSPVNNRDFLHVPLTETDLTVADEFAYDSRRYSSPTTIIESQTPGGSEMMLTSGGDGDSSEDETGLLNLHYQSVEQMAAAILARTRAASNSASSNNATHNNNGDTNSDIMSLEINDDEQAGLAGLDLSLGRYEIDNEGTPHTVTSSSNYSQRWWSQPTTDWDD